MNHNNQYALLSMMENWKTQLKNENKVRIVIMGLFKPLIAKLKVYRLDSESS